ncbi:hypothetical protein I4U23_016293 [Adineta vaga]|nr:hypothetical protein I4U23_016293 [Adineta vaga]
MQHMYYLSFDVRHKWLQEHIRLFTSLRYCRRLTEKIIDRSLIDNKTTANGRHLTFNQLREMSISSNQLLDWYVPLDTIEEYVSNKETGFVFICSNLWFGTQCEYTFDSNASFTNIVKERQTKKKHPTSDVLSITNGTCYIMHYEECKSVICLDWCEICDGKIDCSNGFDEYYCHELEMNECDPKTEYRCFNAQCIDNELYGNFKSDCMDASDEITWPIKYCKVFDYLTGCENHACASLLFSCGDGHCYDGPNVQHDDRCITQRDRLYFNQMPPSTLILYSHIHLIYNDTKPEAICFNQTLCPYLVVENKMAMTQTHNSLTCRLFNTFTNETYVKFDDMLKEVKRFIRSCSLLPQDSQTNQCSLFQCDDQSKCLSYHRLSDGTSDCANEEDERHPNTCSFNLPYRFKCDNETRCLPRSLLLDKIYQCFDKTDERMKHLTVCLDSSSDQCLIHREKSARFNLTFSELCNGVVERISHMSNDTDESHCTDSGWPCSTRYTDCNWIWNCPDGSDELKSCVFSTLSALHCNNSKHFCLDVRTGLPICLPKTRAADGIVDCVGAIDEQEFCRMKYPDKDMRRFRCQNSDICIQRQQICDCHRDCPNNDDETFACIWLNNDRQTQCDSGKFRCRDGRYTNSNSCTGARMCSENDHLLFCEFNYGERAQLFSIHMFPEYPSQKVNHMLKYRDLEQQSATLTNIVLWQCNSGMYVRSTIHPSGFFCLCPNYYYGDRCQFQRKRISLILYLRIGNFVDNEIPIFKFVVLLVRHNTTSSIISHEQFIYTPEKHCLPQYMIELLYPIDDSLLSFVNHTLYIHAFILTTLKHFVSWHFPLSFEFLPVRRIAKELLVTNISSMITESMLTTIIIYPNCTNCSSNSLCLGYDIDLGREICVCPLNHTGRRCLIVFDPCTKNNCNGHGKCITLDIRHDTIAQFMCLCDKEWFGKQCEKVKPRVYISFSRDISIPSSNIAFIHIMEMGSSGEPRHFTYFRRLHRDKRNFTFFLDNRLSVPNLDFIQLYEHQYQFDYYLLLLRESSVLPLLLDISTKIRSSHRCHSIHELFNQTILAQFPLRRVKNYQYPCLNQQSKCFYDDKLICLCDKTNHTICFNFETTPRGCLWNKCHGRGMCVQDDETCPTIAVCICEPCSYGSVCQFSRAGYSLSLDAIIGSHIRLNAMNIFQQSTTIKITVLVLCILIVFGFIFNTLATGTFTQKKTRESGCGLYLLVSSITGLLTMIVLMCKIIIILNPKQTNIGCSLTEFLLKWWSTSCEWIDACVAMDRTQAVSYPTKYTRAISERRAKWIVGCVFIFLALISSPELIFRRIVIDTHDERAWCVLTLNADRPVILVLYSISNVLWFILPLIINFASSIIIIQRTTALKNQIKNKTTPPNQNKSTRLKLRMDLIKKSISQHKHILIAPIVLGCLAVPRLVLSFIFVCQKLDRQPYISLISYCIAFLPCMAIVFVFILPSEIFRKGMYDFMKSIRPQRIRRLFMTC